jgi:hypothetical protein
MSNLFKTVEYEAFRAGIQPRTKESRAWFRRKVQNMRNIRRRDLMNEDPIQKRNRSAVGSMYMFFYDAKHRKTLPYWDAFPLVIAMGPAEGGFYGMNLHYLPIPLRAKFLDQLVEITNNNKYDESTRFEVSYALMNRARKFRYFKPCFKHYLNSQVEGRLAYVPPPEWEIATFLPMAQFQGDKNQVYKDSRRIINA